MCSAHQKLEREADRRLEREAKAKGGSTLNSTIVMAARNAIRADPKEVPRWTEVILFDKPDPPLGPPISGRNWFKWQRYEVEEIGEPREPDDRSIPEGPAYKAWQADGTYLLQSLKAHLPGTYLQRTTVVSRPVPTPPPSVPSTC